MALSSKTRPTHLDGHTTHHVWQSLQLPHRVATVRGSGLSRSYNAILGRPCYHKFMAMLKYTYLKPKMLGPHRIIMISTSFRVAYICEQANCELASTLTAL
jgi:hypothetical protein